MHTKNPLMMPASPGSMVRAIDRTTQSGGPTMPNQCEFGYTQAVLRTEITSTVAGASIGGALREARGPQQILSPYRELRDD